MSPTLIPNDYVVIINLNKYSSLKNILLPSCKNTFLVDKGELVLFTPPSFVNNKKIIWQEPFIKRCIGLPGDSLKIKINKYSLYDLAELNYYDGPEENLNKTEMFQVYVPQKGDTIRLTDTLAINLIDLILGELHTFQKDIDGSIFIDEEKSYSYIVQKNYYFFIGDNRFNSLDSRNFGFVSEENILGKVLCIFWSFNNQYNNWYKNINWKRIGKIPR